MADSKMGKLQKGIKGKKIEICHIFLNINYMYIYTTLESENIGLKYLLSFWSI